MEPLLTADCNTQILEIARILGTKAAAWLKTGIPDRVATVAAQLEEFDPNVHKTNSFVGNKVITDMRQCHGIDTVKVVRLRPRHQDPAMLQVCCAVSVHPCAF